MKLTLRGWAVLAIGVIAFGMAFAFGARSLNAVVGGVLVTLAAGAFYVARLSPPSVERTLPSDATVGRLVSADVTLAVDDPYVASVTDRVAGGDATRNERRLTVDDTTFTYQLHLKTRGRVVIGPLTVRATDVLGLVATEFVVTTRNELLVTPLVRDVVAAGRYGLPTRRDGGTNRSRTAFERLREYTSGDGLRDVHWKSTAKKPDDDLVVVEYAGETSGTIELACSSPPGSADGMAEAAASLAVYFLEIGYRVSVTTSEGTIRAHPRDDSWDDLMQWLSLTDGGPIEGRVTEHDVAGVEERPDGTVEVAVGSRSVPFSTLVTTAPENEPAVMA